MVVFQQWFSLGGVDFYLVMDSFFVVVSVFFNFSMFQQMLSEQFGIDVKVDDGVKLLVMFFEVGVKGFDLVYIVGVVVEQEIVGSIVLIEVINNDCVGQFVGDEVFGVYDGFNFFVQFGVVFDIGMEYIVGRNCGYVVMFGDGGGLSFFVCVWGVYDQ